MSQRSWERANQRKAQRDKALSPLANRRYDEEVANSDCRYDARHHAGSITERNMVAAFIEKNRYQQSRIEEFRPTFRFV